MACFLKQFWATFCTFHSSSHIYKVWLFAALKANACAHTHTHPTLVQEGFSMRGPWFLVLGSPCRACLPETKQGCDFRAEAPEIGFLGCTTSCDFEPELREYVFFTTPVLQSSAVLQSLPPHEGPVLLKHRGKGLAASPWLRCVCPSCRGTVRTF